MLEKYSKHVKFLTCLQKNFFTCMDFFINCVVYYINIVFGTYLKEGYKWS